MFFGAVTQVRSVFITDNSLEFGNIMWRSYHGIIELQHFIDPKQMALLKMPWDEWKKELQQYCYSQDWMKGGGLVLWNAIAICETSKTSWEMVKHRMKDGLENNDIWSTDRIPSDFSKRPIKSSSIWQQSITWVLTWLRANRGWNLERRYYDCSLGRFGKLARIRNYHRRINAKEELITQKRRWIHIPSTAGGTAKLSGRDHEFREPKCRHLVDPRWLHLSSSQWTSSSTLRAEGRNIPYSTETHWRSEVHSYWSGRHAGKAYLRWLESRFEQKSIRFVERLHKFHSIERKTSQRIYVVQGKIDRSSNDYQTRWCVARSTDKSW